MSASDKAYADIEAAWSDPETRRTAIDRYATRRSSFVPGLLPERALRIDAAETFDILRARLGAETVALAIGARYTDPEASEVPDEIASPVRDASDGGWLARANVVGINARTCASPGDAGRSKHGGSFWGVVKYALTLSAAQDTIHLLPFWEAGVARSLYAPSSWELCAELASDELTAACPHLDSAARQLRAVVNLLHALGKRVGFDVLPHTDRYAETVLAFPGFFEWLHRDGATIASHAADLHETVERVIVDVVRAHDPATTHADLFGPGVDEPTRLVRLFGHAGDRATCLARRIEIIGALYRAGLEPVPATMAPPFRGLEVDPDPAAITIDEYGWKWRDYVMTAPTAMSRVFGPLTRFALYEPANDRSWALDFDRPRRDVWAYVTNKYADIQRRFGFDFMRGDMAHVQMRPDGVPANLPRPGVVSQSASSRPGVISSYDLMRSVKETVQTRTPHFGYFAEAFLYDRDVFGYGEEIDHLEASLADVALGDLQSCEVGSEEFTHRLARYRAHAETRATTPCLTMATSDKDDPRFDAFYVSGNELRFFLGLFVTDMPSYVSLGFETRDVHLDPVGNEHYTKLYVFDKSSGPRATRGPYAWGRNGTLFGTLERLKALADELLPVIGGAPVRWLLRPETTATTPVLAWTQADTPRFVFVACTDTERGTSYFGLPHVDDDRSVLTLVHSTAGAAGTLVSNGVHYRVDGMAPAECRAYRVG